MKDTRPLKIFSAPPAFFMEFFNEPLSSNYVVKAGREYVLKYLQCDGGASLGVGEGVVMVFKVIAAGGGYHMELMA